MLFHNLKSPIFLFLQVLDLGEEILKGCVSEPCGKAFPLTGGSLSTVLSQASQNVFSPEWDVFSSSSADSRCLLKILVKAKEWPQAPQLLHWHAYSCHRPCHLSSVFCWLSPISFYLCSRSAQAVSGSGWRKRSEVQFAVPRKLMTTAGFYVAFIYGSTLSAITWLVWSKNDLIQSS